MRRDRSRGFTLIEVIITIALLMTITMAVSMLMRRSLDMKFALSEDGDATHRLGAAIQRITKDVEATFIVPVKDEGRAGSSRRWRGLFQVEGGTNDSDKIRVTTMNHRRLKANASESDLTLVVYEVREDKEEPGATHLFRGETSFIPPQEDLREDPPMKLFVRHVKSIRVLPWVGDDWSRERWDSTRGEWRDKLPRMVAIEVEVFMRPPEGGSKSVLDAGKRASLPIKTAVLLPYAAEYKELKEQSKTLKWW